MQQCCFVHRRDCYRVLLASLCLLQACTESADVTNALQPAGVDANPEFIQGDSQTSIDVTPSSDAGAVGDGAADSKSASDAQLLGGSDGQGEDAAAVGDNPDAEAPGACGPDQRTLEVCETPGATCEAADGCCACVPANACGPGHVWICLRPTDNALQCESTDLQPGAACDRDQLPRCASCAGGTATLWSCLSDTVSSPQTWRAGPPVAICR